MSQKKKKIIIIDALALIFRAYYALPPLTNSKGLVVNAVYGFMNTLFNVIRDYKPDYLCVAFDEPHATFRDELYEEYKAQREEPPADLPPQISMVRELLEMMKIQTYSKKGYEADDVIGSICAKKSIDNKNVMSYILTGDLDTLQLVDDNTHVITFKRGMSETTEYDEAGVEAKYEGLTPKHVIDLKALKGDTSDNVPGVKGVGEKTAMFLMKEFGTLENLYKNIDSKKISDSVREKLKRDKKMALLSKKLVTIVTDVDIKFELEDCTLDPFDKQPVIEKLQEYEFKSLINKLPDFGGDAKPTFETKVDLRVKYHLINDQKSFDKLISELKKQKELVFDTETTDIDPFKAEILGISFSWQEEEAYYVIITSQTSDGLFSDKSTRQEWLEELKPIFENEKIKKVGHNMKYDIEVLGQHEIKVAGIYFDTMVAAYLLNAGTRSYSLDELAASEFSYTKISYDQLTASGKKQLPLIEVPVEKVSNYSCEDADFTFRLFNLYKKKIDEQEMTNLMHGIEMPLVKVLCEMETAGVLIDGKFLSELSKRLAKDILHLEKKIFELAGRQFNIASPIQLQEVLFSDLAIPTTGLARTKTGFSTAAPELEKIIDLHPIIRLIGDYRELTKLKSTYLDALPEMINRKSGRVHTSFNQTIAATGRLSSTNPNLQNIPIRTELGNEVRKSFIAPKGYKILSADYSQIELRLAAHYSKDPHMVETFKLGKDIHTSTAAKIHGIPEDQVTKEIRSTAKEINFGIIYGLGPVGLAQRTGLDRKAAKEFIENYFAKFPGIKQYVEDAVNIAKKKGYAETLFGRRRYLPDLDSGNQMLRAGAERIAVNMPLQGTAADLIKLAMVKIMEKLNEISPKTKMLMQVHDELVFEVPESDVDKVSEFVKKTMESAHKFIVPIKVDVEVGENWGELK